MKSVDCIITVHLKKGLFPNFGFKFRKYTGTKYTRTRTKKQKVLHYNIKTILLKLKKQRISSLKYSNNLF